MSQRSKKRCLRSEVIFDVAALEENLAKIEKELSSEEVWSSPERMRGLQKRKTDIHDALRPVETALEKTLYLEESIGILGEEEGDIFLEEIRKEIEGLKRETEEIELRLLLSGEVDKNNAIVTIHPGAGGTESQDWAQMLMRMYLRWTERHRFKVEVADLQPGDEAGVKSVTFTVEGPYA
ncbi:MAG: PCRF domain-containing protein, partial [Nitrospirales bacterium]|nr:PCRF domain-containing protein [Nitrospirales bacterium]